MLMNRLNFHTFNDTLGEKLQPTTLRVPIGEEMYGAFANISTGSGGGKWLPVHGVWNSLGEFGVVGRILVGLSSMVTLAGNKLVVMDATSYAARLQPIDPYLQSVAPPGHVKFSVVNLKSNTSTDTTFKYYRRFFIEASQFATFSNKNNDYLLVKEKFRSDGKGILLLSTNREGKLVTSPLHLYERYHYSIPQLQQASNGSIVMPFIYKGEVGLAKVSLRPDQ
jgi:hypothetical protein